MWAWTWRNAMISQTRHPGFLWWAAKVLILVRRPVLIWCSSTTRKFSVEINKEALIFFVVSDELYRTIINRYLLVYFLIWSNKEKIKKNKNKKNFFLLLRFLGRKTLFLAAKLHTHGCYSGLILKPHIYDSTLWPTHHH